MLWNTFHFIFIFMEMLLLSVARIYLKTVVITFLETSKLVGLITSGWNVTFWPSVNMQHWPARLQWDNLLGHPDHRAWHQCRVWRQIQILSCFRKSVSDTHKMKIKTYSCNHHMHRMFGYSHMQRGAEEPRVNPVKQEYYRSSIYLCLYWQPSCHVNWLLLNWWNHDSV